jgi:hypothetical protein
MTYHYSPVKSSDDGNYFTVSDNTLPNNIIMNVGSTEMLKVAPDGFYVRGVKVTQDDKEAETVYNAFKAFLVWAELNRR